MQSAVLKDKGIEHIKQNRVEQEFDRHKNKTQVQIETFLNFKKETLAEILKSKHICYHI